MNKKYYFDGIYVKGDDLIITIKKKEDDLFTYTIVLNPNKLYSKFSKSNERQKNIPI